MRPAWLLASVVVFLGCQPDPQTRDVGEEGPRALDSQEQVLAKKGESDCPGVDSIGNDLGHGHPNGFDVEGVVGCLDSCVGMMDGLDAMGEDNQNYACHAQKVEALQERCQTMYDGLSAEDQEEVQKVAPDDLEECLGISGPEPSGCAQDVQTFCEENGSNYVCAGQACGLPDGWFECGFGSSAIAPWTLKLNCACLETACGSEPEYSYCPAADWDVCFGGKLIDCESAEVAICGFGGEI